MRLANEATAPEAAPAVAPKQYKDAEKDAGWVYKLLVDKIMSARTKIPVSRLDVEGMNNLALVLKDIFNKEYLAAAEKLNSIPLPRPNGAETPFKLQARMIVAKYKQQTSVLEGGSLFTWSSSESKKYIANLEKFVREGRFDITKETFERDYLYKDVDGLKDGRLAGILESFNVEKDNKPAHLQQATVSAAQETTPTPTPPLSPRSE